MVTGKIVPLLEYNYGGRGGEGGVLYTGTRFFLEFNKAITTNYNNDLRIFAYHPFSYNSYYKQVICCIPTVKKIIPKFLSGLRMPPSVNLPKKLIQA